MEANYKFDEDRVEISIPGWRYDEIDIQILKMYEEAKIGIIPISPFDIVHSLGFSMIPYRALGPEHMGDLMSGSKDAMLLRSRDGKCVIFYNDRLPRTRINFSLMHEIAHIRLNHQEHCPLAEKEANYFAAQALCPVELLEHFKIDSTNTIAQVFNISGECANNRRKALHNRIGIRRSIRNMQFAHALTTRFKLARAFQAELFQI